MDRVLLVLKMGLEFLGSSFVRVKGGSKEGEAVEREAVVETPSDSAVEVEEMDSAVVVENADIIGLFFTAGWCPPCRVFARALHMSYAHIVAAQQYTNDTTTSNNNSAATTTVHSANNLLSDKMIGWSPIIDRSKRRRRRLVFIIVSSDNNEAGWLQHLARMPSFYAIPYSSPYLLHSLKVLFEVTVIPRLVLLNKHGQTLVSNAKERTYFGLDHSPRNSQRVFRKICAVLEASEKGPSAADMIKRETTTHRRRE